MMHTFQSRHPAAFKVVIPRLDRGIQERIMSKNFCVYVVIPRLDRGIQEKIMNNMKMLKALSIEKND